MHEIRAIAIVGCVGAALFFTLVSTVGVLRLPDLYSRAHTASQADTLGAGFALAAVALSIGIDSTAAKTVLLLFFIFVTNPTAAHAIARAAHEEGIEPWTAADAGSGDGTGGGSGEDVEGGLGAGAGSGNGGDVGGRNDGGEGA